MSGTDDSRPGTPLVTTAPADVCDRLAALRARIDAIETELYKFKAQVALDGTEGWAAYHRLNAHLDKREAQLQQVIEHWERKAGALDPAPSDEGREFIEAREEVVRWATRFVTDKEHVATWRLVASLENAAKEYLRVKRLAEEGS